MAKNLTCSQASPQSLLKLCHRCTCVQPCPLLILAESTSGVDLGSSLLPFMAWWCLDFQWDLRISLSCLALVLWDCPVDVAVSYPVLWVPLAPGLSSPQPALLLLLPNMLTVLLSLKLGLIFNTMTTVWKSCIKIIVFQKWRIHLERGDYIWNISGLGNVLSVKPPAFFTFKVTVIERWISAVLMFISWLRKDQLLQETLFKLVEEQHGNVTSSFW